VMMVNHEKGKVPVGALTSIALPGQAGASGTGGAPPPGAPVFSADPVPPSAPSFANASGN
jgi:hypothetical protein